MTAPVTPPTDAAVDAQREGDGQRGAADPPPSLSQQDRCSAQKHLWRRHHRGYMRCVCGAVHPRDIGAFLRGDFDPHPAGES
jgi:hypothetical protein